MTLSERFWAKVGKSGECWLWTGAVDRDGYGEFYMSNRQHRAHRVAFVLVGGVIPNGLTLDHLCRVRACVNPTHLEPVTNRENILRGVGPTAQHAKATHCPYGHPLSGENLGIRPGNRKGQRYCRECRRTQKREAKRRQRAAARMTGRS